MNDTLFVSPFFCLHLTFTQDKFTTLLQGNLKPTKRENTIQITQYINYANFIRHPLSSKKKETNIKYIVLGENKLLNYTLKPNATDAIDMSTAKMSVPSQKRTMKNVLKIIYLCVERL